MIARLVADSSTDAKLSAIFWSVSENKKRKVLNNRHLTLSSYIMSAITGFSLRVATFYHLFQILLFFLVY